MSKTECHCVPNCTYPSAWFWFSDAKATPGNWLYAGHDADHDNAAPVIVGANIDMPGES